MAIHINKSKKFDVDVGNLSARDVHYVPCKINYEGNANVSKYFSNLIFKQEDDRDLQASLRGYPLNGRVIDLPKDYQGLILRETVKPVSGNNRTFHVTQTFNSLTYWNWDKTPSKDDAFLSALDWIDVAEVLHAPVEDADKDNKVQKDEVNE